MGDPDVPLAPNPRAAFYLRCSLLLYIVLGWKE
jgi:hypothetical protein